MECDISAGKEQAEHNIGPARGDVNFADGRAGASRK